MLPDYLNSENGKIPSRVSSKALWDDCDHKQFLAQQIQFLTICLRKKKKIHMTDILHIHTADLFSTNYTVITLYQVSSQQVLQPQVGLYLIAPRLNITAQIASVDYIFRNTKHWLLIETNNTYFPFSLTIILYNNSHPFLYLFSNCIVTY